MLLISLGRNDNGCNMLLVAMGCHGDWDLDNFMKIHVCCKVNPQRSHMAERSIVQSCMRAAKAKGDIPVAIHYR